MDVGDEGLELALELDVVVRAAEPPLIAELEEGDAAHVAAALVEGGEVVGDLPHAQRRRERPSLAASLAGVAGLLLGLVEVGPGVLLAEVHLANAPRLEFRDVEHGRIVTLLALHGDPVAWSTRRRWPGR
mgnify:CR=1 FL=1